MGLVVDSDVLILAERHRSAANLSRYAEHGDAYISVLTASELLVGVNRATDDAIRARRLAYVEGILSTIPLLPIDLEVARIHAQLVSQIPRSETIGAHDVLIAATAMRHGYAVLTRNGKNFRKLQGVTVVDYIAPSAV